MRSPRVMAMLNLPKEDLIQKLEERKDAIRAEYKEAEDSVTAELARRKTAKTSATAQAEWYEEVAAGLRSGDLEVSDTGKLRSTRRNVPVPPKPGSRATGRNRMMGIRGVVPEFTRYDDSDLEGRLVYWPAQLEEELKPIDSAIDLLNLATDQVVEVDSDNYSALLSGANHHHRRFFF